ncbi:MAG: fasciclin domain-containing protein [Bacteroidota bacterium]
MNRTKLVIVLLMSAFALVFTADAAWAQCGSKSSSHQSSNNNWRASKATYRSAPATASHDRDLVGLAASSGELSTLVAAIKAAGLVETLQGQGPFTVFAPTNAAFSALPEGTLESLLKPENKTTLIKILTYHVVPGRIEANDLSSGKVASVEGSKINVEVGNAVKVNEAIVVDANNRAVNGVVHVIDRVILPPGM